MLLQFFNEQSEVDVEVADCLLQQLCVDDVVVNGNHVREQRQVGAQEGRVHKRSLHKCLMYVTVYLCQHVLLISKRMFY